MSNKDETVGVRINSEMSKWLDVIAKHAGVRKSEVVREALEEYRESRDDKLMKKLIQEDGYLYKMVQNNGNIAFKRVKKELIQYNS